VVTSDPKVALKYHAGESESETGEDRTNKGKLETYSAIEIARRVLPGVDLSESSQNQK
jgi:hypothetical protein